MLSLHTRSTSPFTKEFWKWVARRSVGKYSGPNAVEDSLLRGLKELGVEFRRNVKPQTGDTVIVLSGIQALREAITLKQRGIIKKLIAGPNIVAHPMDAGGVMLDKTIDIILVPSQWVANFWAQEAPELTPKLQIWASGVQIYEPSNRSGQPIIYNKLNNINLLNETMSIASGARIFNYGTFAHADYLRALKSAPYLIYLAKSESQGLALQEAWAHGVPTLINKNEHFKSGDLSFVAPQINCPYLTPELGIVFRNTVELPELIEQVKNLQPKIYCDQNLSDKVSAQKLLKLL